MSFFFGDDERDYATPEVMVRMPGARWDRIQLLTALAEWLVSLDDPDPDSAGFRARRTVSLSDVIGQARIALGRDAE